MKPKYKYTMIFACRSINDETSARTFRSTRRAQAWIGNNKGSIIVQKNYITKACNKLASVVSTTHRYFYINGRRLNLSHPFRSYDYTLWNSI